MEDPQAQQGPPMPPQEAPQEPQQGGGGEVGQLLIQASEILNQLAELFDRSQLPDQDKQSFNGLNAGFQQFIQSLGEEEQQMDQGPEQGPPMDEHARGQQVQPAF